MLPGQGKYLFVYPFVKTRAWYNLSPHARQGMMDEHINARDAVQGRPHQHQLQLRHRRPGVRRLLRLRLPAGVRRPRRPPALHGGQPLHAARHADVHLRQGRAGNDGGPARVRLLSVLGTLMCQRGSCWVMAPPRHWLELWFRASQPGKATGALSRSMSAIKPARRSALRSVIPVARPASSSSV